ncbi:transposase, partial [Aeromonas caviae]
MSKQQRYTEEFKLAAVKQVTEQGESVNILLNFTQFFETRIEYRFQI